MTPTQSVLRGPANATPLITAQKEQFHYASILGSISAVPLHDHAELRPVTPHSQPKHLQMSDRQKVTTTTTVPAGPGGTSTALIAEHRQGTSTRPAGTQVKFELIDLTDEEDITSSAFHATKMLSALSENAFGATILSRDSSALLQRAKDNYRKRLLESSLDQFDDLGPLMNQSAIEPGEHEEQTNSERKKHHASPISVSEIDRDESDQLPDSALLGENNKFAITESDGDQQVNKEMNDPGQPLTIADKNMEKSSSSRKVKDTHLRLELAKAAAKYEKFKTEDRVPDSSPLFHTDHRVAQNTSRSPNISQQLGLPPETAVTSVKVKTKPKVASSTTSNTYGREGTMDRKRSNQEAKVANDNPRAGNRITKKPGSSPLAPHPAAAVSTTLDQNGWDTAKGRATKLVKAPDPEELVLGKMPEREFGEAKKHRGGTENIAGVYNNVEVSIEGGGSFLGQITLKTYGRKWPWWTMEIGHIYRDTLMECVRVDVEDLRDDTKVQFCTDVEDMVMDIPLRVWLHKVIMKFVFKKDIISCARICNTPGTLRSLSGRAVEASDQETNSIPKRKNGHPEGQGSPKRQKSHGKDISAPRADV